MLKLNIMVFVAISFLCTITFNTNATEKDSACLKTALPCYKINKDTSCFTDKKSHFEFSGIGVSWFTNSNLNSYLKENNFLPFHDNAISFSLGEHKTKGKCIEEHSISGHFFSDNVNQHTKSSLMSFDAFNNCGHNLLPISYPLSIYPYSGLGLSVNALHIRANSKTLADELNSEAPNAVLIQGALLINAGIGSDFTVALPDNKGGIALGIRTGWCYDLYTFRNWYSGGTAISDVPKLRHNGGYVKMVIGGWDNNKKHCEKGTNNSCSK